MANISQLSASAHFVLIRTIHVDGVTGDVGRRKSIARDCSNIQELGPTVVASAFFA